MMQGLIRGTTTLCEGKQQHSYGKIKPQQRSEAGKPNLSQNLHRGSEKGI